MLRWLTTPELARLAEVNRQTAHEAICRANSGLLWRGVVMTTRVVPGRGGRSGLRYEVLVPSLPPALYERWKAAQMGREAPSRADVAANAVREFRYQVIAPALAAGQRHSPARGEAIARIVATPQHHPRDGRIFVPARTIHRWIERFEGRALGLGGLQPKHRKDRGSAHAIMTELWDRSVPFDEATMREIAEIVRQDLRDLWGNGSPYSAVRRLASEGLETLTRGKGFDPGAEELARICRLPKNVVESERDARKVHTYRTDRKAWNDRRGRVSRSLDGLEPMQLVIGDVHPVDIMVERQDGSAATARMIAWLDVATHRIRFDLVLCEPGTDIRNADLIGSFVEMACDPEWGMPAGLYVDNGSEYGFVEFLDDAPQLRNLRTFPREKSAIMRSTPYEPASKGLVEGSFAILERLLATVEGHIGGERMNSKSATLGRPQLPFDGGFDAFAKAVQAAVAFYNTNEKRGQLKGRSPDAVFRAWVKHGWQRVDVEPEELMMAFSVEATRVVRQGQITVAIPDDPRGSIAYVHDSFSRREGETVAARLPKFQRWSGIPVYTLKGERIGVAEPKPVHGYLDEAGAREAARLKKRDHVEARELAKTVRKIDVPARMAQSAAAKRGTEVPESAGTLRFDPDRQLDGRAVSGSGSAHDEERARQDRAQQHNRDQIALMQRAGYLPPPKGKAP